MRLCDDCMAGMNSRYIAEHPYLHCHHEQRKESMELTDMLERLELISDEDCTCTKEQQEGTDYTLCRACEGI